MRRLRRSLYSAASLARQTLRYRMKVRRLQRSLTRADVPVDRAAAKRYWRRHFGVGISTRWHYVYAQQSGRDDARFVPEDVFYNLMEPVFNVYELHHAYADKNLYSRWLPEEVLPLAVLRSIHGRFYDRDFRRVEPAEAAFDGVYFIKPTLASGGGRQVARISVRDGAPFLGETPSSWQELQSRYAGDFILQQPLVQHPALAAINPSSINTLRIMTLRLDEPWVVSSVFRLGSAGSHVDNMTSGGSVVCGVDREGRLNAWASDRNDNRVFTHPDSGYRFDGQEVPGIQDAWDLVLQLHRGLRYFDLASWDIAIGPDSRPTMVEVNLRGQEISFHQVNNGPLFGDRTEEVLHHVRARQQTRLTSL
jgi:hypothetical protein